ncbi:MerR family transcriptional regulator [Kribbella sp. VKM Ac-2566]|uniref:MerR family transcriptional regulator n=1 Tax=Kribbella sp. VKM Ac-2566 TaxID=2512218 RepID=UPI0010626B7F|nr:MerR family transcriptional regulator [Kribbella sp. VKM Ac-2566]TDW79556.1 DNA-binding transcriptional MerR regulator [Kribbella sp. VKM Ac-2566]
MSGQVLSIGEVAKRTGLSVHALRLYEREGLLAGTISRDRSGRRVYRSSDVEWILNCIKFRASGMSLANIRRLAELVRRGEGNEAERLEVLREHSSHISAEIAQLLDCLELVNGKIASYERHLAELGTGDPW